MFPGAHKIGAAISGPRMADTNFTDTRIFLFQNYTKWFFGGLFSQQFHVRVYCTTPSLGVRKKQPPSASIFGCTPKGVMRQFALSKVAPIPLRFGGGVEQFGRFRFSVWTVPLGKGFSLCFLLPRERERESGSIPASSRQS